MDKKIYNSLIENSSFNVKIWQRMALAMLAGNLLLIFYLITANRAEKTIVIPPDLKKEFWIRGDEVSPIYLEQMGEYFFQLLLTYNKENVMGQYQTFLHHVSVDKYSPMKSFLFADADRIKRNEFGSVFYPLSIKVRRMRVETEGEQLGIIGEKVVSRKKKKYQMTFNYKDGHLNVESYSEI